MKKITLILLTFVLTLNSCAAKVQHETPNKNSVECTSITIYLLEKEQTNEQIRNCNMMIRNLIFEPAAWAAEKEWGSYDLGFGYPNRVTLAIWTPDTLVWASNNRVVYSMHVVRRGSFEIQDNNLILNFTESLHDVRNTFDVEWLLEAKNVILEVKTIERGEKLIVRQISGENIFEKSRENEILEFQYIPMPPIFI